jgi:two-component system sensor histidine kinase PilS (NtrC family)
MYSFYVVLFSGVAVPSLGYTGIEADVAPAEQLWLITITALQVMIASLVVVTIRRRMETLRTRLSKSVAVADELSVLYRNVVESMNLGLLTTDLSGILTSVNPFAERILQTGLLTGQPLRLIFDAAELTNQKTMPDIRHFERNLITPKGGEIIVGGSLSPLMDSENRQSGFLLLFEDLTEQKAMEARLRLSERFASMGQLSSGLAHEIRTPLASIQGCVQILRRPDADSAIVERVMTILLRESERVGAVVSGFLELASPRDLRLEFLWLPEILDEVRASWETDPRHKGFPLVINALPEIWILGDRLASYQILTNLLSNAYKSVQGRSEPCIRISSALQNESLELTVTDNGIGMTKEQVSDIFVPFYSGFCEGTGIGMSLVFQFAQAMGWEISVKSEVEKGSAISLAVPYSNSK